MQKAHRYQTELIQNEAQGNKTEMSVILVHAQDHIMNAMNYQRSL
ncbi:MAG: PTS lactose/cellobiose transporter subunit IIA [Peptostreptococcaceae bacterium]|nr:PTS lactose/cellobiose transporter subunit IIA [Peptostreptococcaceae bacterium]